MFLPCLVTPWSHAHDARGRVFSAIRTYASIRLLFRPLASRRLFRLLPFVGTQFYLSFLHSHQAIDKECYNSLFGRQPGPLPLGLYRGHSAWGPSQELADTCIKMTGAVSTSKALHIRSKVNYYCAPDCYSAIINVE